MRILLGIGSDEKHIILVEHGADYNQTAGMLDELGCQRAALIENGWTPSSYRWRKTQTRTRDSEGSRWSKLHVKEMGDATGKRL